MIMIADAGTQRQCRHQGGASMRAISWNLLFQTGSQGMIIISHIISQGMIIISHIISQGMIIISYHFILILLMSTS